MDFPEKYSRDVAIYLKTRKDWSSRVFIELFALRITVEYQIYNCKQHAVAQGFNIQDGSSFVICMWRVATTER